MDIATWTPLRDGCVALLAIAVGGSCGCIVLPIPHRNVDVMPVVGVLREGDVPVTNRALSVEQPRSRLDPCSGVFPVVTDASGVFRVQARRRWRFWILLLGESEDWHIPIRLCIRDQERWRPLHLTYADGWEELRLVCDLTSPAIRDPKMGDEGVCVASRQRRGGDSPP